MAGSLDQVAPVDVRVVTQEEVDVVAPAVELRRVRDPVPAGGWRVVQPASTPEQPYRGSADRLARTVERATQVEHVRDTGGGDDDARALIIGDVAQDVRASVVDDLGRTPRTRGALPGVHDRTRVDAERIVEPGGMNVPRRVGCELNVQRGMAMCDDDRARPAGGPEGSSQHVVSRAVDDMRPVLTVEDESIRSPVSIDTGWERVEARIR